MNVACSEAVEVASGPSTSPTPSFLLILSGPCRVCFHTSLPPGGNLQFFPPDFSSCPDVVSHAHKEIMQVSEGVPCHTLRCLASLGYVNIRYCERRLRVGLSFSEAHVMFLPTPLHLLPLLRALPNLLRMCWDSGLG